MWFECGYWIMNIRFWVSTIYVMIALIFLTILNSRFFDIWRVIFYTWPRSTIKDDSLELSVICIRFNTKIFIKTSIPILVFNENTVCQYFYFLRNFTTHIFNQVCNCNISLITNFWCYVIYILIHLDSLKYSYYLRLV